MFVCVLAYLFEQELQVMYRQALDAEILQARREAGDNLEERLESLENERYTGEQITKELGRWKVMKAAFLDKTFVSVPPPPPIVETLMRRLRMKKPSKMIEIHESAPKVRATATDSANQDGQMAMDL
jgi:hypothetical protein